MAKVKKKEAKKETAKEKNFRKTLVNEMLKLSTSALGLVAALAWNELIKEAVSKYIQPVVGGNSGLISLFIYAIIVTILAVTVTYQLSKLVKRD